MGFFASLSCMKANLSFIPSKKMSIPTIKLSSQSKPTIPNLHPPKISKTYRDASFSSHIHGAENTFVLKRLNPTPYDHIFHGRNVTDDGELDVFNAEKYFSEGLTHIPKVSTKNLSGHHVKKDWPLEIFEVKKKTRATTLSIRSESSSNSRSVLLNKLSKSQQPRRTNRKSFLANIGCNVSCKDKNSLEVDDYSDDGKSKQGDKTRDGFVTKPGPDYDCVKFDEPGMRVNSSGHFSFRVSNSRPGNGNQAVFRPRNGNQAISRPGNGHQAVFRPGSERQAFSRSGNENLAETIKEKENRNSLSLEKNLTMFSWDEIKIPSKSSEIYNDSDSDASSDLFEIESFSTGNHFLSRQASDGQSGCYAPSEASVDWSMVTATAADNFSVPLDSQELKSTIQHFLKVGLNSNNRSLVEIPKRRSSILSGCKSQKAVRVAGDAHRSNYKAFSIGNAANLLYTW